MTKRGKSHVLYESNRDKNWTIMMLNMKEQQGMWNRK